jgi:hypothetical protein
MIPEVSILMATRDNLATLPKALETFLASPLDLEIVIVNDGSTDGTRGYLDSLPRVRPIHLAESGGLTKALNLAFRESKGRFLARQDADDYSHADRLPSQLEAFGRDRTLDILGTGHRVVDEGGAVLAELPGRNFGSPAKRLARDNYFCHGSLMFRRAALERLGGYREFFRFSQDYDLMLRAAGMGMSLRNLGRCLYDWTFSPQATSGRKAREQARYAAVARRLSGEPGLDPAECYRAMEASESGADRAASAVPMEWHLMKIHLRSGDTARARAQYDALLKKGGPLPDDSGAARLRLVPGWLYKSLRALTELKYR